jgi:hypothetical protein
LQGISGISKVIFRTVLTYDLSTVTVTVGGHSSDPYVLPSPAKKKPDQRTDIKVYRSLLDPKVVSDIFGRRIAQRFVVLQVTIANKNDDYQYLIHDVIMTLTAFMRPTVKGNPYTESSADLSMLRGVAEKGQSADGRNLTLRILRGAGSVAAGLIGVTDFGSSYAPAVAVFNGPVIAAYSDIFPDYTIGQMNRLSDSAYAANTVIPKQQSKVMAVFLPQAIYLNPQQRKAFWKDPTTLWAECGKSPVVPKLDCPDFRYLEVLVDGDFITTVAEATPSAGGAAAPAAADGAAAPGGGGKETTPANVITKKKKP